MIGRIVIIILLSWVLAGLNILDDKIDEIIRKHESVRLITAKIAIDVIKLKKTHEKNY